MDSVVFLLWSSAYPVTFSRCARASVTRGPYITVDAAPGATTRRRSFMGRFAAWITQQDAINKAAMNELAEPVRFLLQARCKNRSSDRVSPQLICGASCSVSVYQIFNWYSIHHLEVTRSLIPVLRHCSRMALLFQDLCGDSRYKLLAEVVFFISDRDSLIHSLLKCLVIWDEVLRIS